MRATALIVACVMTAACGSSTSLESRPTATTAAPTVAQPATSTPAPTPTGPKQFTPGETGTVTWAAGDAAQITIGNVRRTTKAPSQYAKPPANGVFLTVDVVVKAVGNDVFDINPFDFYARTDDGTQYEYGGGNSLWMLRHGLNGTALNPGEQVKGPLSFDVPAGTVDIVYAPGRRALGYWRVP